MERCTLFADNLPVQMKLPEFEELLNKYGQVEKISFLQDKGIAYIEIDDRTIAKDIVNNLNNTVIYGRKIRLGWSDDKKSEPKEKHNNKKRHRNFNPKREVADG